MIGVLILTTALVGGPWSPQLPPWPDVDRRSPKLVAKIEARKKARHKAAVQSRKDFDRAMEILKAPPEFCPCHATVGPVRRVR